MESNNNHDPYLSIKEENKLLQEITSLQQEISELKQDIENLKIRIEAFQDIANNPESCDDN